MHAFFDGYVNSRSTLKTFVEQYEIAMTDKIRKEMLADYQSKFVTIRCQSEFRWEEQFAKAYTNNVFELLQKEIKKMWNCNVQEVSFGGVNEENGVERFEVLENQFPKNYSFTVEYQSGGEYISCNCRKMEFKGILYVHILKVLVYKNIKLVNERYILRRWRKDVYRPHSSIYFAGGYPHMTDEYKKFQEAERDFQECTDLAYDCADKMNFIRDRCKQMKNELLNWKHVAIEVQGVDPSIQDPLVVRGRGRPKQTRFKSIIERAKSHRKSGSGRGKGRNSTHMG